MSRPETDACRRLVALADRLADRLGDASSPRAFVRALAREGAGVRGGPLVVLDLARGGSNPLRGRGFRRRYDDGTDGQVRHFCGVARAAALIGPGLTRRLMVRSGDRVESPDGQLTEAAIEFVRELTRDRLAVRDAGAWIDRHVCSR